MYSTGSHLQFRQHPRYPRPYSGESLTCNVCKITVKGQDQYKSHMMGSKHAKKVREQENMKKVEDNPYLRLDDYSGGYECTACKVTLNSSSVAMFHLVGSRHVDRVKALETGETPTAAASTTETTDAAAVTTATANTGTTEAAAAPASEGVAAAAPAADAATPAVDTLNRNGTNGQPEQAEQPKQEQAGQLSDTAALLNSGLPTEFGTTKVVHNEFFRPPSQPRPSNPKNANIGPKFKYNIKPLALSFVSKYTAHAVDANVATGMNAAPRPRKNPGPPTNRTFPCLACNIVTNSETQLQAHLSSEKHKSRLSGSTPCDRPPQLPAMSSLRCESCNIFVNSQIQLDQHLQSPKHRQRLQTRYNPYPPPLLPGLRGPGIRGPRLRGPRLY